MLPSVLLAFDDVIHAIVSISPIAHGYSPLGSSVFELDNGYGSIVSNGAKQRGESFDISPDNFSSNYKFSVFNSAASSYTASTAFNETVDEPFDSINFEIEIFSYRFEPRIGSVASAIISSVLVLALSDTAHIEIVKCNIRESDKPLSSSSSAYSRKNVFLLSVLA